MNKYFIIAAFVIGGAMFPFAGDYIMAYIATSTIPIGRILAGATMGFFAYMMFPIFKQIYKSIIRY